MDFTITLSDKQQIIALQALVDDSNKHRPADGQVDMQTYLQEQVNGIVNAAIVQFKLDLTAIDTQIAELQAARSELADKLK